jgi:hypothetical protein
MKKRLKKQKKLWKRPLKRKGLTDNYYKMRQGDPDAFKNQDMNWDAHTVDFDDYWDVYGPDYYDYENSYDESMQHFNLHNILLSEIIKPSNSPFGVLESIKQETAKNNEDGYSEKKMKNPSDLYKKLYKHIKIYTSLETDDLQSSINYIRACAGGDDNIKAVTQFAKRFQNINIAKAIMFFSPFWIRSPKSWDGDIGISFITHIFSVYDTPKFLVYQWFNIILDDPYNEESFIRLSSKWFLWFLIIGQGGSLKKAASIFGWQIPSKFQHYLEDVPPNMKPVGACVFAEVKRLGGNEIDANRILEYRSFVIDSTNKIDNSEVFFDFWQDTVRWLISNRDNITDVESYIILQWAMHKYTETERDNREAMQQYSETHDNQDDGQLINANSQDNLPQRQTFEMKGRSVQKVLEHSNEYFRQQNLPWSDYYWQSHGWDYSFEDTIYSDWEIIELTDGKELFRETQALYHCVSSYAGRCVANVSAIFSMRFLGQRTLTIEVNPTRKQIVQIRGQSNRNASESEIAIITIWEKKFLQD